MLYHIDDLHGDRNVDGMYSVRQHGREYRGNERLQRIDFQ